MTTPTDSELLMDFVRHRRVEAFEQLLHKHAGMVLSVCLQILRNRHDAEDAFQATFLILAQRADHIQKQSSVAAWLHGVAYRTAMRAAKQRRRRQQLAESVLTNRSEPAGESASESVGPHHADVVDPWVPIAIQEEQAALHEALAEIPRRYRAPLVLCYLQGKTRSEAAEELETTAATVKGRLARGKKLMRLRLARRGVMLSAAMVAAGISAGKCQAASAPLISAAASHALPSLSPTTLPISNSVTTLANQGILMMQLTSLSKLAAALCLVILPGVAWLVYQAADPQPSHADTATNVPTIELAQRDTQLDHQQDGTAAATTLVAFQSDDQSDSNQTDNNVAAANAKRESEDKYARYELEIDRVYREARIKALLRLKEAKDMERVGLSKAFSTLKDKGIISPSEGIKHEAEMVQLEGESLELEAEIIKLKLEIELIGKKERALVEK